MYEYTGEEFDPKTELKLEQLYGGKEVVDSHNITADLRPKAQDKGSNSTAVAQTAKNATQGANKTAKTSSDGKSGSNDKIDQINQ